MTAENCAGADHLRHEERDVDARLADGLRDGVSQARPVIALDEQRGRSGSGQANLARGGGQLLACDGTDLDHGRIWHTVKVIAHHHLQIGGHRLGQRGEDAARDLLVCSGLGFATQRSS